MKTQFEQLLEQFIPNKGFRKRISDQYIKDLVSFGNFLIKSPDNDGVTDTQLANWKFIETGETVSIESESITITNTENSNLPLSDKVKILINLINENNEIQGGENWIKLENLIKESKEKPFLMDLSLVPISEEFTIEKWIEYFNSLGINYIENIKEEEPEKVKTTKPKKG